MRLRDWALLLGTAGGGMLTYGALVEAKRLVVERPTLRLPGWPESLRGYRIALLADFHLRDASAAEVAGRAVEMALAEEPDAFALAGDFAGLWKPETPRWLGTVLEPLADFDGPKVAVPGNHDWKEGSVLLLGRVLAESRVRLLRNESWTPEGITWVGVDSYNAGRAAPRRAMWGVRGPAVALWHEADLVRLLPQGCALQLSGHSHGGQFRFPFGITPMHSTNGRLYVEGFFPEAPTPLYVTRGVGTTALPTRFLCPPEVSILTLVPA